MLLHVSHAKAYWYNIWYPYFHILFYHLPTDLIIMKIDKFCPGYKEGNRVPFLPKERASQKTQLATPLAAAHSLDRLAAIGQLRW